jgi:hypothetical protein
MRVENWADFVNPADASGFLLRVSFCSLQHLVCRFQDDVIGSARKQLRLGVSKVGEEI